MDEARQTPMQAKPLKTPINGVVLKFETGKNGEYAHGIQLRIGREIAVWLGLTGAKHQVALSLGQDGRLWLADDGQFEAKKLRGGSYQVAIDLSAFDGALWLISGSPWSVIDRCTVARGSDGLKSISFPTASIAPKAA